MQQAQDALARTPQPIQWAIFGGDITHMNHAGMEQICTALNDTADTCAELSDRTHTAHAALTDSTNNTDIAAPALELGTVLGALAEVFRSLAHQFEIMNADDQKNFVESVVFAAYATAELILYATGGAQPIAIARLAAKHQQYAFMRNKFIAKIVAVGTSEATKRVALLTAVFGLGSAGLDWGIQQAQIHDADILGLQFAHRDELDTRSIEVMGIQGAAAVVAGHVGATLLAPHASRFLGRAAFPVTAAAAGVTGAVGGAVAVGAVTGQFDFTLSSIVSGVTQGVAGGLTARHTTGPPPPEAAVGGSGQATLALPDPTGQLGDQGDTLSLGSNDHGWGPGGASAPDADPAHASDIETRTPDESDTGTVGLPPEGIIADPRGVSQADVVLVRHIDKAGVERFLVIKVADGDGPPKWRLPSTAVDAAELPMPRATQGLREQLGVAPDYAGTLRVVAARAVDEWAGSPTTRIVVEASERFDSIVDASAKGVFTENAAWMTHDELLIRQTNRQIHRDYGNMFHTAPDEFPPVREPADSAEKITRLGSRLSLGADDIERLAHNLTRRPSDEQDQILAFFDGLNRDVEKNSCMAEYWADSIVHDRDGGDSTDRYEGTLDVLEKKRSLAVHPDIVDAVLTPMSEDILGEFARNDQWRPGDVGDAVAFLRRPTVAADLRTIQQHNPHVAWYVINRVSRLAATDLDVYGRELHTIAKIPAGAVTAPLLRSFVMFTDQGPLGVGAFTSEGLAARDRRTTTAEDRAWSFMLALDDFSPSSVKHRLATTFLEAGQLANLPEQLRTEMSFSAGQLRGVEDTYLAKPHSADFTRYVEEVGTLPASQQPLSIRVAAQLVHDVRPEFAQCVRDLLTEGAPERDILGLRHTGDAGINELKEFAGSFTTAVRSGDLSPENVAKVQSSDFVAHLLIDVAHYATSDWGPHGMDSLRALLAYRTQAQADGRIEPMPAEYRPSEVLEIAKLRTRDDDSGPQWTEDLLTRYHRLSTDLHEARTILTRDDIKRPFTHLLGRLGGHIADHVQTLKRSLDTGTLSNGQPMTEKARQNMVARVDELEALIAPSERSGPQHTTLRSLKDFERNFLSLARVGDLHSDLRTICFAWAMRKHPEWVDQLSSIRPDEPTLEDVSRVREFVDHITNQEVFADYFSNRKGANTFRRMTSTVALEEAMLRTQGVGVSSDTTRLQFVPSRGPLLELSGHIASACWAGKYDSVAEAMPNMTAVTMIRNPDDPTRTALAGAGLLIETTSDAGDPVLLIRGLNPSETYINLVSVDDFYQKFTGWAKEIAAARGSRLAIVIDDHVGGSSTNRPVLFGHLKALKQTLTPIRVNGADTEFNGYKVTRQAYLVE